MKALLALLLGGFGLGAWVQRRRRKAAAIAESSPADELRARLAETRAEPVAESEPEAVETDPETRRREVHERARQSLDELG